jgi:hypothetical protein
VNLKLEPLNKGQNMNPQIIADVTAFDYDKQVWVQGEPARTLRIRQLTDEIQLLTGPRAAEYVRFMRLTITPDEAAATLKRELDGLLAR